LWWAGVGIVIVGSGLWYFRNVFLETIEKRRKKGETKNLSVDFKSMFLGVAIGDAFGAGIEFQDRRWMREHIDFTQYVDARSATQPKWKERYKPGMYTDDTEQTIGTVKALMEQPHLSEEILVQYWKKEYDDFKKIHNYGRAGHGSIEKYYEGQCSIQDVKLFQAQREMPGNAPTMRAIPLAFVTPTEKRYSYANISADASHPHIKARASSQIIVEASRYIFEGNDPIGIIKHCMELVKDLDKETFMYLAKIDKLGDYHTTQSDNEETWGLLCGPPLEKPKGLLGLPCDAMRTAGAVVYLIKFYEGSAFDILKYSIWVGGDVDSLASICLGIIGGHYGLNDLPSFLFQQLEGKAYIEEIAEKFQEFVCKTFQNH